MKTLIIVILVLLSVATMPLSLKKAIERKHHLKGADVGPARPQETRPMSSMSPMRKDQNMQEKSVTIMIPQWQGGGQDLCTYDGGHAFLKNYLGGAADAVADISRDPISPVRENILGLDDILGCMRQVNGILEEHAPTRIFTVGGGCDADTPCAAWLNKVYDGDLAVVYIDSHGDLNTPESSESHLYYGMSLRALAGESAQEIIEELPSTISPRQIFMCAGRNLDPEEIRYKAKHVIDDFTVGELAENPDGVATAIRAKGFRHIYIHIDLDALDPEEFSLTPLAEPHGMTKADLLRLLRSIAGAGEIVGFGLLEYCGTEKDQGDPFLEELTAFALEHIKENRK